MPTTLTPPKKSKKKAAPAPAPAATPRKTQGKAAPVGTYQLRARVPADRYRRAEAILAQLGLTPAVAVNMLLAQIEEKHGIPFDVTLEEDGLSLSAEEQGKIWDETMGVYEY